MNLEPVFLVSSLLPILVVALTFLSSLNKALSDDLKIQIGEYLNSYSARDYAETTKTIFDKFYGPDVFSLRSFVLSSITSLFTVFSTSLILFGYKDISEIWIHFFYLAVVIATLNFLPDFASLCQTRFIVGFMKKSDSFWFQLVMTIVDLILSLAIIFIYLSIYFLFFHKHIPIIYTVKGFDVLQVVVFSTLIFSVLNLIFSLSVLLITKTPKEFIFKHIERPIYLISLYAIIVFAILFAFVYVATIIAANLNIGQLIVEQISWISVSDSIVPPDVKEVFATLIAFLTFIILASFALSQCVQSFRNYASTSLIFKTQIAFTASVTILLACKLVSPTLLTELDSTPFVKNVVNVFIVPDGIPKWQIVSIVNGLIALSITIYVFSVTINKDKFREIYVSANDWFVTSTRLVSSALSAYTVCILVYNIASIQWDLLPICEEWTPWQNSERSCTIIEN